MRLCTAVPLLVDGQLAALPEDAHVVVGQRPTGKRIVRPILSRRCLLGGCGMALEAVDASSAAMFAHAGRFVVVPMRQIRVARVHLDALHAGAVVVIEFALRHRRHGG